MISSAPVARAMAIDVSPAVTTTCAPACFASCAAMLPSGPPPPWISTFWPGRTSAMSTTARHAASAGAGSAAAPANDTVRGFRATCAASTATYSA